MRLNVAATPTEPIRLRDYQSDALEGLRHHLRAGKRRLMLYAPTGAGKTEIAMAMLEAAKSRGNRSAFICDLQTLVRQTSERLWTHGIYHGVIMSDETKARNAEVVVCSAQTLERSGLWPDVDLVIVDEAHTRRKKVVDWVKNRQGVTIGLSATPWATDLTDVYEGLVSVISTDKLLAEGYLAPIRVCLGTAMDMTGAETSGGEWTGGAVERRGIRLVGDVVENWITQTRKFFGGPVKTLVFSGTVKHGEALVKQFTEAGFQFRQISYRSRDAGERIKMVNDFREGKIHGLISCEALAKGFDVPDVMALVDCRPYKKSLAAHIQKIGRLMRAAPGKEFGLLLDHTDDPGNWLGFHDATRAVFAEGVHELAGEEKRKPKRAERRDRTRICRECQMVAPEKSGDNCPYCGADYPRRRPLVVTTLSGNLIEVPGLNGALSDFSGDIWVEICLHAAIRHPDDDQRAHRFANAQFRSITGRWPPKGTGFQRSKLPDRNPDKRVAGQIERNFRKWLQQQRVASYRRGAAYQRPWVPK